MKEKIPSDPKEAAALREKIIAIFEEKYGPGKEDLHFSQVVFVCEK